ncbi:carboxy terminal-processing peptidase [Haoranjiania flava]|uniref:Carboxy terminal-processing peptidase n=1 Tax=Haoranjiania flava TaxID=1856322 RepID=A0AAE3LQ04_9BACT|nr:carboxy terminal-processing peptidase [Haoranjiania flava]MCU7694035.1 carboxy terminal-processing peptidase [Haoranjiania flava]
MISRKLLPVAAVVIIAGLLVSGSCKGNNENDSLYKQQQLLVGVGIFMQRYHYAPKAYDDKFSEAVFNAYLGKRLDPEKAILLQKDIDTLNKYKLTLDDELRGEIPLSFYPNAVNSFKQRIKEAQNITNKLLAKPFTFTANEVLENNRDSANFPANEAERDELWRKRIKYQVLTKYYDLYSQREKAKADDPIKKKTDAQLEKEAREKVKSIMDRYFKRYNTGAFEQTKQFSNYLNAIADQQDPHTAYMAPFDKADFDAQMSNKIIGIGAQLREENGEIKIVSVVVGGPAWKTKKVHANDIITKVSTGNAPLTDLAGYELEDAIKLIRGVKGTKVNIVLKKTTGVVDTVSMLREEINIDEAAARSVIINNQDKKIGYLYLPEFYADFQDPKGSRIARDVKTEIEKMKAEGIDGMIVDLRFNPGGSLYDVNQIIGYFINSGPVVQVKNRQGRTQDLKNGRDSKLLYDGPLAVMINEMSASASEIFAAAIQDYKRGIVVGSTSTYGKGTVQRAIPLGDEDPKTGQPEFGSLKLTIEKFYRINGTSNQKNGVASDVVLPDIFESLKIREKDQPNALNWDKIAPATFSPWKIDYNFPAVKAAAIQRINNNKAFELIKKTSEWMAANQDRPSDLNFEKYKAYQLESKKIMNTDDTLSKLKVPMNVAVLQVDRPKFYENKDKSKQDFYQKWLEDLKKDIYIDETSRIVYDMIRNARPLQ